MYFVARPQVMVQPVDAFILDSIEQFAVLVAECSATGNPVPNITWSVTSRSNSTYFFGPESMAVNTTLSMNGVVMSTFSWYNVTIANRGARVTCIATNEVATDSDYQLPLISGIIQQAVLSHC